MSRYFAAYKCQLCGALIKYGDSADVPPNALPNMVGQVIRQNQLFAGNPALQQAKMYIPHQCKDGGCGMAVFAGFRKEY